MTRRFPRSPIEPNPVTIAECVEQFCCHNCRYHAPDMSHPCTDGIRMSEQRGWVCLAPEFDVVFSGWPEHGICEMWDGVIVAPVVLSMKAAC